MQQSTSLFSALGDIAQSIHRIKQAASPVPADPGGYFGASTHPTANVDNSGQSASEGSRSSENEEDVNKDQGKPGVNQAPTAQPGQQSDVQLNIGTNQSATGEDPSVEDAYKGGKDDPGSSHPARTDNDSLDGEKYAKLTFSQGRAKCAALANDILAAIANGRGSDLTVDALNLARSKQAGAPAINQQIDKAAAAANAKTPAAAAMAAGYELAAALGAEKTAAEQFVTKHASDIINDAIFDADLVGGYLTKLAEADGPPPKEDDGAGSAPAGDGDADDAGAPPAGPPAGGAPAGGAPAGGPPMGGGGEPSHAELMTELISALEEMGISPEEFAQFAAAKGGDAGGGAPPAGGPPPMAGLPPMGGPPAGGPPGAPPMGGGDIGAEGMKLAAEMRRFQRTGQYQRKNADDGTRSRALRDRMKAHVREMIG